MYVVHMCVLYIHISPICKLYVHCTLYSSVQVLLHKMSMYNFFLFIYVSDKRNTSNIHVGISVCNKMANVSGCHIRVLDSHKKKSIEDILGA